jgi:hypothetical protein
MTPALATVGPAALIHRIGRGANAWEWPDWAYAGDDGTFGNRFDDPRGEYRVLYASTQRLGTFLETLARFRPDPALVAAYAEMTVEEGDDDVFPTIPPGHVPRDWVAARSIGTASHAGPFADIGHADSLAHLRVTLASRLLHYGLDELDAGDVRKRAPRPFTQELSRYVFEHGRDDQGTHLVGIRYGSRLGDNIENWAIFEGTTPEDTACAPVADDDEDLATAMEMFGLRWAT